MNRSADRPRSKCLTGNMGIPVMPLSTAHFNAPYSIGFDLLHGRIHALSSFRWSSDGQRPDERQHQVGNLSHLAASLACSWRQEGGALWRTERPGSTRPRPSQNRPRRIRHVPAKRFRPSRKAAPEGLPCTPATDPPTHRIDAANGHRKRHSCTATPPYHPLPVGLPAPPVMSAVELCMSVAPHAVLSPSIAGGRPSNVIPTGFAVTIGKTPLHRGQDTMSPKSAIGLPSIMLLGEQLNTTPS